MATSPNDYNNYHSAFGVQSAVYVHACNSAPRGITLQRQKLAG
jgi:hypothetical protein